MPTSEALNPFMPQKQAMAQKQQLLDDLESIINKITTETLLAQPGRDEGMIPIYSLLTELEEQSETVESLPEAIMAVKGHLDSLLDECKPFEASDITLLKNFETWFDGAIQQLKADQPVKAFDAKADAQPQQVETSQSGENDAKSEEPSAKPELPEEQMLVINMDEDIELLQEFVTEAMEHLEAIEEHVLTLENQPQNTESLNAVFRAFHTIKGVAGFLALLPVQSLAHEVESLLDMARNHDIVLNSETITLILESRDALLKLVQQLASAINAGVEPDTVIPIQELIFRVKAAMKGESASPIAGDEPAQESTQELPQQKTTAETEAAPTKASPSPETQETKQEDPKAAKKPTQEIKKVSTKSNALATIRVDSEKVSNLMDMVGELVIVESQLSESVSALNSNDNNLQRNIAQLTRITKDLQHTSMALRLVPIKPTFQKVSRMVRDIARSFNKDVRFSMSGEDTELDRNVVETIADPLTHMVRNAIDHGLEPSAEDREKAGKPRSGHITLKAYHMGSNIVIELSDDGRGINKDRVLAKARERNLIPEDREITPEEINQLIFHPGFSTAEKVTDISGRGVGMDVVRKNIEALRGTVVVTSEEGRGSNFKIKLPLTTAIIEGLVIKVGYEKFILPTNSVKVTIRPTKDQLTTITGTSEVVVLRDQTIPLIRLHTQFGIDEAEHDPTKACLVIIDSFGKNYALLVDELVHKQEVVIKSLGSFMNRIAGVAGGAILGDGTIALIIDTVSLLGRALGTSDMGDNGMFSAGNSVIDIDEASA